MEKPVQDVAETPVYGLHHTCCEWLTYALETADAILSQSIQSSSCVSTNYSR